MDYDFSVLCAEQIDKLKKRTETLHKAFVKEYRMALNVINSSVANEHRGEMMIEIEDMLRDQMTKSEIFYIETLNKIQRVLHKHL